MLNLFSLFRRCSNATSIPLITVASLAQTAPVTEQSRLVRVGLTALAVSHLPLVWLALILSAVIFWTGSRWQHLRWLAALVLFGYAYNAAGCRLEVAIANSLDVHRHITVQMYATLLTQCLAFWLILEFALDVRRHRCGFA